MATPDHLRNRYIDELLGATSVLASVESAAVAEAWASGAVAEWAALGGAQDQLAKRIADHSPLGAALITWMEGGPKPTGEAEWVDDVGRHELTRSVRLIDADMANEVGVILEYVAPSGERHDLSVTISGGAITGIAVGPEGLAQAALEDERDSISVEALDIGDALEIIREALRSPIPELSAAAEATLPLVIQRVGVADGELAGFAQVSTNRQLPERYEDDDRYAADVIRSSMRAVLAEPAPDAVEAARLAVVELVERNDPDALTVFEVAGIDAAAPIDTDTLVRLVGAYLSPKNLDAHTDPQFAALIELEPADWVGVVLGMARAAVGTEVDGRSIVGFINKAPEITTSIPKADAPHLAWTFEQMLFAWEVTGVLTDDGFVSNAARWLLPQAAVAVWS